MNESSDWNIVFSLAYFWLFSQRGKRRRKPWQNILRKIAKINNTKSLFTEKQSLNVRPSVILCGPWILLDQRIQERKENLFFSLPPVVKWKVFFGRPKWVSILLLRLEKAASSISLETRDVEGWKLVSGWLQQWLRGNRTKSRSESVRQTFSQPDGSLCWRWKRRL